MSQLFVDNIKNRTGGAVGFPTGVVVTGVATFNNQVSIAGTLTYEDVTNVDSTGIITAKSGVKVTGGEILVGSGFSVGQAGIVTASGIRVGTAITIDATSGIITATSFSGPFSASTGSFTSDVDIADKIVHTGDTNTAIRFPAADTFSVETGGTERIRVTSAGRVGIGSDAPVKQLQVGKHGVSAEGTIALASATNGTCSILMGDGGTGTDFYRGYVQYNHSADAMLFATSVVERLRITSRGGFQFSNGLMSETVNINTTARTGTQAVNLDDGMVHYFSTNSAGTWKPNFTMSAGDDINATIAIGDVFSPTMIVAKGATTHFANAIQVDGSDVTPEFSGGAPTDGGGSGTFDVYNYTIIKTGDDTFKAFAAISNYE